MCSCSASSRRRDACEHLRVRADATEADRPLMGSSTTSREGLTVARAAPCAGPFFPADPLRSPSCGLSSFCYCSIHAHSWSRERRVLYCLRRRNRRRPHRSHVAERASTRPRAVPLCGSMNARARRDGYSNKTTTSASRTTPARAVANVHGAHGAGFPLRPSCAHRLPFHHPQGATGSLRESRPPRRHRDAS